MISPEVTNIALARSRIRLALRIMIAAADADIELHRDAAWQRIMTELAGMLNMTSDIVQLKKELRQLEVLNA